MLDTLLYESQKETEYRTVYFIEKYQEMRELWPIEFGHLKSHLYTIYNVNDMQIRCDDVGQGMIPLMRKCLS